MLLALRVLPQRGQRETLGTVRIVDHFALLIEDHGGSLMGFERRPIGKALVVRIAGRAKAAQAPLILSCRA